MCELELLKNEKYSYKISDDGLDESIDILGADEEIFVPNDVITEVNVKKIVKLLNKQDKQIKELELNSVVSQNCMNILATIIEKTLTEKLSEKETIDNLKLMFEELSDLAGKLEEFEEELGGIK